MSDSLWPHGLLWLHGAHQAPLSIGKNVLQARILEWVAMPSSRGFPDPGIEPTPFTSPELTGGLFTSRHQIAFIKLPPCTLCPFFTFDQTILFLQIALSPDGLGKILKNESLMVSQVLGWPKGSFVLFHNIFMDKSSGPALAPSARTLTS